MYIHISGKSEYLFLCNNGTLSCLKIESNVGQKLIPLSGHMETILGKGKKYWTTIIPVTWLDAKNVRSGFWTVSRDSAKGRDAVYLDWHCPSGEKSLGERILPDGTTSLYGGIPWKNEATREAKSLGVVIPAKRVWDGPIGTKFRCGVKRQREVDSRTGELCQNPSKFNVNYTSNANVHSRLSPSNPQQTSRARLKDRKYRG